MQLRLIRNATLRLNYAGRDLLTDPFLAPKHSISSFAGISPNPIVDLPCSPQEAIAGVEIVLLSHLHSDHFDQVAQELLSKSLPIFCQPGDETRIAEMGFQAVTPIKDSVEWQNIRITRTLGRHGTGKLAEEMGQVSGFVFQAEVEPTLYWAGDTVWYEEVQAVIEQYRPDVVIVHASGAKFGDSDPIVKDTEQTIAVCQQAALAMVIAVHLESLDHGTVSRAELREAADANGIQPARLLIPADGETISLQSQGQISS